MKHKKGKIHTKAELLQEGIFSGEGLLTQMAIVPQNFDAGTLLLRLMEWLLTQGPLMPRNLTQGGF